MKITTTLAVAVGLAALAGCNKTAPEQNAENIEANADAAAENIEANADAVADNLVANADNAADATAAAGDNAVTNTQ
jgi:vacuolar-type H+-ATPase subunit E/Vma4